MLHDSGAWKSGDGALPARARAKRASSRASSLDAEATRRWTRTLRSGASDGVDFRLDLDAAETSSLVRLLAERRRSDPVGSAPTSLVAAEDDDAAWETVTSGKRSGGRRANGSASNSASTEKRRSGNANPNANGTSGNEGSVAAADDVAEALESATVSEPAAPPKAPKGWAAILTGRASSATLTPSEAAAIAAEEAAEEAKRAKAAAEAEAAARAEEERERRAAREQRERERKAKEEKAAAAAASATSKAEQPPKAERKPASAAAAPAAVARVASPPVGDGNGNVGKPFAGWASVVSGKTPDPAKEGWKTLVGGKLDAEQSPTATVTLDGAVGVKNVESTTETRSASPPAILAPTKKPQGASKLATTAAEPAVASAPKPEPPELRKAWTGWAVAAPPPKVDLKAEMEAAKATRAATPPPQLGKKDAASSESPRRDADDKKGAASAVSKKGGKTAGGGKPGNQPPPPAGPRPGVGGRSFSPPPPPASPPPTMPATSHAPARPFVAAPAPPNAPAESPVDDAFAKMTGDAPAAMTDAERRAALAARLGAEMLEMAHVQPRGAKGATLRAERRATDLLIRAVNAIVQSLYPQASVEVFGSFPTASWTPGASNLDMALCLPESATSTPQAKIDALNSLAVALRSNGWVTDVNVVPSAFRPLIMMNTHSAFFQAVPGGGAAGSGDAANANGNGNGNAGSPNAAAAPPLPPGPPPPGATLGLGLGQGGVGLPLEVHISVKDRNHKGAATVKFLQQAEAEYPALAPVLAVQKAYLASRGLRGVYKGGIGSYSLALLALHALQRKAHEDKTRGKDADAAADASPDAADARILGESMLRFLEFYGHGVDLTRSSIKVHALRPVGKAAKKAAAAAEANGGAAAVEWGVLSSPSHAPDGSPRAVVGGGILQVQDPMQAGHNAGGGCFGVAGVQASFREQMQKLAGLPEDASLLQHLLAPPPGSPPAAAKVCVV